MRGPFKIGFTGGFILGVVVCLSMDIMLGSSIGGGWGEAVSNDLFRITNTRYPSSHPIVIFGVILVISLVGVIGGLMGGFFLLLGARLLASIQARSAETLASQEDIKNQDQ